MAADEYPPQIDFEPSDVSGGCLLAVGIAIVISAIMIHAGVAILQTKFASDRSHSTPPPASLAVPAKTPEVEAPLQTDPKGDYASYRERQTAILDGYGWVDRNAAVVRIPIDQAMRIVVERGLPPAAPVQSPPEPGFASRGGSR